MFIVVVDSGDLNLPRNCQALSTDKPFPTTYDEDGGKGISLLSGSICQELDTGITYKLHDGTWYAMGNENCILLTAGVNLIGNFKRVKAKKDCSFETFTGNTKYNSTSSVVTAANVNADGGLLAGDDIWGAFTTIKLSVGSAWVYV